MAFKLPSLKPKTVDCSGLPVFDFGNFFNKEEIRKGGYGSVFTADFHPPGVRNPTEKVAVKKILGENLEEKRILRRKQEYFKSYSIPTL